MSRRPPFRRGAAAALLLALAACGAGGAAEPPSSVLLVTIDTLRADRLGCYGYDAARTPTIDALAARGVRFESVFSVAPLTLPSHTSLLTGTLPPSHGVRENGTFRALPELVSLAEVLRAEGLRTGAFVAAYVLDAQFGLDQGFEAYGNVPQRTMSASGLVEDRPAGEVNEEALRWLQRLEPDEDAFLWVHYFEPHLPYPARVPPEFAGRPYDAEVATADRALRALLEGLERLGRAERTLVVLTSDHGESLGEHGEETHSFFVYQGVIRIPLILAHASLPRGAVRADNVSLVDVMPTVLELLGVAAPDLPPPGHSLVPLLEGDAAPGRPTYFESLNPWLNYGWAPLQGVAVDRYKYIRAPRAELYDLAADPAEAENRLAELPEVAAQLERALQELLAANERPDRAGAARRALSAEDRAALASLGYVGTASPEPAERTLADPKDGIERIRKESRVRELFAEGRLDEIEVLMRELLAEDPDNGYFHAHFGVNFMMQERYAEAVPHLERALELGYRTADHLSNLGTSLLMSGDTEAATEALEAALALDEKHLLSLFWLAQAQLAREEPARARATLRRFLALWRGGADPMVQRARQQLDALKGR